MKIKVTTHTSQSSQIVQHVRKCKFNEGPLNNTANTTHIILWILCSYMMVPDCSISCVLVHLFVWKRCCDWMNWKWSYLCYLIRTIMWTIFRTLPQGPTNIISKPGLSEKLLWTWIHPSCHHLFIFAAWIKQLFFRINIQSNL